MKTFRVRETYKMVGWTYVKAATLEEAHKILEGGGGDFDDGSIDMDWMKTDGDLEEWTK